MNKTCARCKVNRNLEKFTKNKNNKDGHSYVCWFCEKVYRKFRQEKRSLAYKRDRIKILKKQKEYMLTRKVHKAKYDKKYKEINRNKKRKQSKKWKKVQRKTNPLFRLKNNLCRRVNDFIRSNGNIEKQKTESLLGCSYVALYDHIEKQFKVGMTWENYGHSTWHIDHIIPLTSAKNLEELKKLYHYTNLQPLWAKDNFKKNRFLSYSFVTKLTHHNIMNSRNQDEIENETSLFQVDYDFARKHGGPIVQEFLDKIPLEYKQNLILDSRLHYLEKGWYPARMGFHTDFVPRTLPGGLPDLVAAEKQEHYIALIGDNSQTEFVIEPLNIKIDASKRETFYQQCNEQIEILKPKTMQLSPFNIWKFSSNDFHRASSANKPGWRLMIRASLFTGKTAKNKIKKQVQVFLPKTAFL
jgi:hypothetical protein